MTALVQRGVLPTLEAPDDTGKAVIVNPAGDNYVLGAAQSGASVGDSRLSLYGDVLVDYMVVLTEQESAGADLTLAETGVVTVDTEGVYAVVFMGQSAGVNDAGQASVEGTWTFDWECPNWVKFAGAGSSPAGWATFTHRFAAGDTLSLRVAGISEELTSPAGAMNIVRLS